MTNRRFDPIALIAGLLILTGASGPVPQSAVRGYVAAAGSYTPNTAYFAGDAQCYLQRTPALWADGNSFYFSAWIKPDSSSGTLDFLFGGSADGVRVRLNTSDKVDVTCEDSASTDLITAVSTASITRNAANWTHIFIRLDRSVDNQIEIYVNGTEGHSTSLFLSTGEDADPIDLDNPFNTVGSAFGSEDYGGCMADVWISAGNTYANITIGDFYSAGDPVDLGATGTGPDGSQPAVFLKGSGTGFTVNSGSGGNFTKSGTTALTTCSTAP